MRVLLTGATGTIGQKLLPKLVNCTVELFVLSLNNSVDQQVLKQYLSKLTVIKGSVCDYETVLLATKGMDYIIHAAAIVAPKSEKNPQLCKQVNCGGMSNFIKAITELHLEDKIKFIYFGSVAQTGDRLPPYHWGQIKDPIHPVKYDCYALTKTLAEYELVESNLKYWVALRLSGVISKNMLKTRDSIIFHQPLNNCLEYVCDLDVADLVYQMILSEKEDFYQHFYNVGGGKDLRLTNYDLLTIVLKEYGINDLAQVCDLRYFAKGNFHGHFYLDSAKLNNLFPFQKHDINYLVECLAVPWYIKYFKNNYFMHRLILNKFKQSFQSCLIGPQGVKTMIAEQNELFKVFFKSMEQFQQVIDPKIYRTLNYLQPENKLHYLTDELNLNELCAQDVEKIANFRGGHFLGSKEKTYNLNDRCRFTCQHHHQFTCRLKTVVEGGYWCNECMFHYSAFELSKKDKLLAQIYKY